MTTRGDQGKPGLPNSACGAGMEGCWSRRQGNGVIAALGWGHAAQPGVPCRSQQQPLSTVKPRYLEQLENYLRKELLLLDLGTDNSQELRLQVGRATE